MAQEDSRPRRTQLRIPFARAAPLLLLAAGAAQALWGEVIPVGNGLGWDGRFYANAAADLPATLADPSLDGYRLRRLLPSAVVYGVLTALGVPRTPANARDAFAWLNVVLNLVTLFAWTGICNRLRVAEGGRWMGFLLLFVSFATLEMPFYYSVLTDTAALTLGALLLYLHLCRRPLAMAAVLLAGAFTWPSFLVFGSALFLWPFPEDQDGGARGPSTTWSRAAGTVVCAGFLALSIARHVDGVSIWSRALASALVIAYLYTVTSDLLNDQALSPAKLLRSVRPAGLAAMVLTAAGASIVAGRLAGPALFTPGYFLGHLVTYSVTLPGIFVVAHAAYFGLLAPVLIVLWRPAVAAAHGLGPGFTLYLLTHLVWGIHSESRQIVDGLPAFVLAAVLALSTLQWPRFLVPATAITALVLSKAWLTINRGEFLGRSDPSSYPAQLYFLNHGPWMARENWALQGTILVATCGLLWWVKRRLTSASDASSALPPLTVSQATLRVIAACLVAGLALVLVELAVSRSVRADRHHVPTTVTADPGRGWRHVPGTEERIQTREFATTVAFNEHGLRGPLVPTERRPGVRRVMLLGDTFVEGHAVAEEASVRGQLARVMEEASAVEVLNAGVTGYGTTQESQYFRCEGHAFAPDLVVVFFRAEDLEDNASAAGEAPCAESTASPTAGSGALPRRAFPGPVRPPDTRPARGSVALRLLANRAADRHPRLHRWMLAGGLATRADPPAALWGYGPVREVRPWWTRTEDALSELRDALGPRGRLIVFYVPEAFEVDDSAWDALLRRYAIGRQRWSQTRVFETLAEVCARLGIPLVDPRPALRSTTERTYFPIEGVWTAEGHRVAAQELARAVGP